MARTKADAGRKAGGKAPRKAPVLRNTPTASGRVSKRKSRSSAGSRNAVCKRPVPKWQVSVKDLAWMKPGSSKDQDQEAEVIDLELEGSPATTCGSAASNSISGDEEYGCTNSENREESIDEEDGVDDGKDGENGREDEEGELLHDSEDSDESMDQENGDGPVEDVKVGGVDLSEIHEVSTTDDLVKHDDEDVSLGEKVSVDDTEEKVFGEIAKELNMNDEKSEISVQEDPKEIAEEHNKNGEKFEIAVKDPKEISEAEIVVEKDEENAESKNLRCRM